MVTIVFSKEPMLAKQAVARIIKKDYPTRDDFNYISFNMAVTPCDEIAFEAETLPLGYDRKAIVAEDCDFLAKRKTKYKFLKGDSLDKLAAYCANPNEGIDLYLLVYCETLDLKNPVVAEVKNKGAIKEVKPPEPGEWLPYLNRFFAAKGTSIDPDAAKEFLRRVDGDYARFVSEARKLLAYANGEPVRLKAVEMLVSQKLEDDAFKMSNALTQGNPGKALAIYRDLKVKGTEEIRLINMLASQFRFMDEVAFLDAKGMSSRAIAGELGGKPFRVEMTLRGLYGVEANDLARIQEELYQLEKDILTGQVDARFALERFLANFRLK